MKQMYLYGVFTLVLFGCASTTTMDYKEVTAKENFGYSEKLQDDGSYILSIILPNSGAENKTPFKYWDRRAVELCGHDHYEKNIYKAMRPTQVTQGAYVYGGVGMGGGSAGAFTLEGKLVCEPEAELQ